MKKVTLRELNRKTQEKRRYNLCIEFNICPVCGEPIVRKQYKKEFKGRFSWLNKLRTRMSSYFYSACIISDEHYISYDKQHLGPM